MKEYYLDRELLEELKTIAFLGVQLSNASDYCQERRHAMHEEMHYCINALLMNDVPLAVINAARKAGKKNGKECPRQLVSCINALGCGYTVIIH